MLCSMDCHSGSGLPDIDQLRLSIPQPKLRNAVWPPRHPLINKATSEDPSQILDGMHLCTTRYPALLPQLRTVLPGSYRSCPALARCSHSPKLPAMASSSHSDSEREQQGVEARRWGCCGVSQASVKQGPSGIPCWVAVAVTSLGCDPEMFCSAQESAKQADKPKRQSPDHFVAVQIPAKSAVLQCISDVQVTTGWETLVHVHPTASAHHLLLRRRHWSAMMQQCRAHW